MTRILIADDHDVVRSGIRRIIEDQPGWSVVAEATNGKDAVAQAMATKPDVAILDYRLPLIDGIEATRQIRRRVPSGGLPHVAIPRITLESGRSWPASGLAGAQRRPE